MKYCRLTGFLRRLVISYQLVWTTLISNSQGMFRVSSAAGLSLVLKKLEAADQPVSGITRIDDVVDESLLAAMKGFAYV